MKDLNERLQPLNSPIARNQGAVSSYDFDAQNERNSVNLTKIKNFSFSSGVGGTLTLGGTANGAGVLLIKDANGNIIVQGDSTGLTVFDGNLVVQNDDNTTIIDTSGIISTANFATDQVFSNILQTTASTSPQDVTGSSLAPFTLSRSTNLLVTMTAFGYNNNFDADGDASMAIICNDSIDGDLMEFPIVGAYALSDIDIDFVGESWSWSTNLNLSATSMSVYTPLDAGTHTLKLQFYSNSSGTSNLAAYLLNYMILGS